MCWVKDGPVYKKIWLVYFHKTQNSLIKKPTYEVEVVTL